MQSTRNAGLPSFPRTRESIRRVRIDRQPDGFPPTREPPKQIRLRGLLTRELSIAEASFGLMATFFLSAALGSVRQELFNATFGVTVEANAYYAAFRLPDTLFSLIAGGVLSSAMIPVLLGSRREDGDAAAKDWLGMRRTLIRSLLAAVGLSLPALAALILLGRPTIRIIFERGQFTAAAGYLTYLATSGRAKSISVSLN